MPAVYLFFVRCRCFSDRLGKAQVIGYVLVLTLLGVAGFATYRVKRRRKISRDRAILRETLKTSRLTRTTFRGLYPYQEGDVLPGEQRIRQAQTIFTQITDPNF